MRSYRLPWTVVPSRYEIELEPDLGRGRFTGRETIEVAVKEPVQEIVLNAADLEIHAAGIRDKEGREWNATVSLDEATERAHLLFPKPLPPGPWRLAIAFTGILNDKLRGFYRSTFTAAGGAKEMLAVTQFEATDARRAFPCWDEPAFKAIFQVTLLVDEGLCALSNSSVASTRPIPERGKVAVTFAPTIPMSTYLLAFVIGRLEATEPAWVDKIPIRVWAVPGKRQLGAFALEAAAFSVRFFQDYYGIPYPGEKLDLIAIPDFAFGAMENLGAITFRETALLVDERAATLGERTRVAHVVIHEIAHMWFGDLVTMAWWNGLWLNEAFATLMEVMAVDAWKPAWGRWDSFGASRAAAFMTDGLRSSRPIEFEVVAPKDAEAMFDVLTYEKGGAVLRMLEQYLGPEIFRDGVRRYLAAHQFANAETTDLWKALGEAAGQPIPAIMDGWIYRQGYPLLTVALDEAGQGLRFSQRAFRYLEEEVEGDCWQVPITYRVRVDGEIRRGRLLLGGAEERVPLPGRPDWVVVNEGGHGFYRVRYASPLLDRLLRAPSEAMAPIERFNLINDAWAATLAGIAPVSEYLELTARFKEETDRHVWMPLLASFGYLSRILPPDLRSGFESLVRDRLGMIAVRLGWTSRPDEDDLTRQLRGDILRAMGTLGNDADVQAEARAFYARHDEATSSAEPGVLAAAIAILAHAGGEGEYEMFRARFKDAKTPQDEQRYLHALAGFRAPELIRRTLISTVSGEVRTQDAPLLARDLLVGVHSRAQAWSFVKEHWDEMERLYPSLSGLARMCEGITALATPVLEADVRQFFALRTVVLGGKILEQYLEQLRIAVAFREREADGLAMYLGGPSTTRS
ncbi:MAG: M1 family metallopeptidase [candidate division NC10 bacterium]